VSNREELLEELVFQVLERREGADARALEELCLEHPELAAELRRRMSYLAGAGLMALEQSVPKRLGEFRLLRRLGQGGMGAVYLAEQPSLGRRVALKIVRPEQLYFAGARERFRREVELVARMAHPGIVAIHAVGEEQGLPYYCMELVEGASLAQVLESVRDGLGGNSRGHRPGQLEGSHLRGALDQACRVHGFESTRDARDGPFHLGWVDACAWLVREAAQALEHAHQRGVLHRDVKPSNLLLSLSGRLQLVDFGLAATHGGLALSRTGSQTGSLPYMSPEQLAGDKNRIGPHSDVYALGVVLYELLALAPPFADGDPQRLAHKIARGRPPALREHNSAVPADLALVCATAMDLDPSRRYPSAAHLARDLTNFLQRLPIEARPLGPGLLLRRWVQRRPAAATALGLSAAAAVLGPLVFGLREARSRSRIERERTLAEHHLSAALDAIEFLLEKVGHSQLRDVPQVAGLRRDLLERANALYARLETETIGSSRPADPTLRLRAARAQSRLARLRAELGEGEPALAGLAEAEAKLRALQREFPRDIAVTTELGQHLAVAAMLRLGRTNHQQGIPIFEEALALLGQAAARPDAPRRARAEQARALLGLAHYQQMAERFADSRSSYLQAEALGAALRAGDPSDPDALELWVTAAGRLGNQALVAGAIEDAQAWFERTLETLDKEPKPSGYARHMRALTLHALARIRARREGPAPDARVDSLLESAAAGLEQLTRDFPYDQVYAGSFGSILAEIGRRALQRGDAALARIRFTRAVDLCAWRVERTPLDALAHRELGLACRRLAEAEGALKDLEAAESAAARAVDEGREAWRLMPSKQHADDLRASLDLLADVRLRRGDSRGGAAAGSELAEFQPCDLETQLRAAQWIGWAALVEAQSGAADRAAELRGRTLELLRRAWDQDPAALARVRELVLGLGWAAEADFAGWAAPGDAGQ
jgi:serine/threonine protein kinase